MVKQIICHTVMTISGNKKLETSRKSLRYFLCIKFSQNAERTCVQCPSTAALLFTNPRKKHGQNDVSLGETSQKNITLKFALLYYYQQCCGSMTFWCGSGSGFGSADPCLWLMDPDSDPSIFIIDLHDAYKKLIFCKKVFLHITFWRYFFIIFHR